MPGVKKSPVADFSEGASLQGGNEKIFRQVLQIDVSELP
jgi:hypothetical protein